MEGWTITHTHTHTQFTILHYSYNHVNFSVRFVGKPLPPAVEAIKQKANAVFEKQQYHQAILLYNTAIAKAPQSAVLYGNRAAAYMKRGWYIYLNSIFQ